MLVMGFLLLVWVGVVVLGLPGCCWCYALCVVLVVVWVVV